jgi:AraC-like DNA-binding protein
MPIIDRRVQSRLALAYRRLNEPLTAPCSVSELAAAAAMSRSHFIRRFTVLFGETPLVVRTRARMQLARELLASGQGSVTEICFALGYSSPGSFSSLFNRCAGEPPQAFRRRYWALGGNPAHRLQPGCISLMTSAWVQAAEHFSRSRRASAMTNSTPTLPGEHHP